MGIASVATTAAVLGVLGLVWPVVAGGAHDSICDDSALDLNGTVRYKPGKPVNVDMNRATRFPRDLRHSGYFLRSHPTLLNVRV